MGRLGSGLVATAFVCVVGSIAFVGCSADGGAGDFTTTDPTPTDPGTGLPPSSSSSSGEPGQPDSGKKDSGKTDAAVDAGPPPPVPGESCTKLNDIFEKQCGACGKHSAVCLEGDAGTGYWSDYSACSGELVGGCEPGATETEACGNCGTRVKTCSKYCAWSNAQCTGQPADSCPPGSIDLISAGCSTAYTYRQKSCKADCTYNPVSATCDAPPTFVNVPPTVGGVSYTVAVLDSNKTLPKITGTCPTSVTVGTVSTPYVYIQVKNTLAKAATVSIYNSVAPGGVVFDTTLASYAGAVAPTADAARKACEKGVSTYGTTALTGDFRFASLDGTKVVTIPAGSTVSVYVAAEKVFDGTKPTESTGPVKLNVRTESLAP